MTPEPRTTQGELILGIDLGTTTIKAALYTPEGELVGLESEEYLLLSHDNRIEADPEVYWGPVARALKRVVNTAGPPDRIAAVSTSTFGESIFPLLADGSPARPSISWMDMRSGEEASLLKRELGGKFLQEISGQGDINATWPATKILWMARNEPEVFARTVMFLLPDDYLLYRLSGVRVAEHSMWGSSLMFDIRTKQWADPVLTFLGIRTGRLPAPTPTGTVIGTISPTAAAETGLSTRTRVVAGAMDQMCAAVGAGNILPGIVTESTGTVIALVVTIDTPIFDPEAKIPCHIHAVPGKYCLLPWSPTGGMVLKWFKDRFGEKEVEASAEDGKDPYDLLCDLAETVSPGSDGLTLLPFLEGAGFPEFEPRARGVLFGLTLRHGKAHVTRAILESIAYMVRADVEALQKVGVRPGEIRVLGGGAKSRLWSQIKADVLGLPVVIPEVAEAAVLGAAIIASVGAGIHPDFPAAVAAMTKPGSRLMPQRDNAATYDEGFRTYQALFEKVRDLF
jgi:xylulokinase